MLVSRFSNAASFLSEAEPFLLAAEAENALLIGLAHALVQPEYPPAMTPYFACATDSQGRIALCAWHTHPRIVGVTRATRAEAIRPLAEDVNAACSGFSEIVGPEPTISSFAPMLAEMVGKKAVLRHSQRIHVLTRVEESLPTPPGRLRLADASDLERAAAWFHAFNVEVEHGPSSISEASEIAEARIRSGKLYFWEDGEPVSMAARTGKTPNGERVNFVYTPPELRGRGYATACVAALSRRMLHTGNRFCCLYTDLANPISNAIYRRIGYQPVCDGGFFILKD